MTEGYPYTAEDRKVLEAVGKAGYGPAFIALCERMRAYYMSIEGIDRAGDVAAQVEGRDLFAGFLDDLLTRLGKSPRPKKVLGDDEGL